MKAAALDVVEQALASFLARKCPGRRANAGLWVFDLIRLDP